MSHDGGGGPIAWLEGKLGLKFFDLGSWVGYVGDWGISRGFFLSMLFTAEFLWLQHLIPHFWVFMAGWLVGTAPIWLPIGLIMGAWRVWIWYVNSLFLSGRNPILLEMKVPREITKSPRAMELAFALFSISSGETTFIHRAWKGQVRPFFSFEIASFGGELHFFIWCWRNYKGEVESAIYGQYPEVELHEVEDYAMKFQYDPDKHNVFCTDWRIENYIGRVSNSSFNINAYQPKTYVDFELDKDPKEEYKIDPLSTVLEFMSNIEPQEQIWVQHVIRKCGNIGVLFQTEQDHEWIHMVEHEVNEVRKEAATPPNAEELHLTGVDIAKSFPHPTWKQTEQIRSMERHLGKYPFEWGGRAIYITTGHMHGPTYTGMRWLWKPFGNPHYLGQLRPRRWHNPFDYPWQDVADFRWKLMVRRCLDAYRRRLFFHSPWIIPSNILTNETLASLWHPPSATTMTPGLQRIPSTKAAPPSNLPK